MDPRDLVRTNRYIGPTSFSVDLLYGTQLRDTNWGIPAQPFVVQLSSQIDEGVGQGLDSADDDVEGRMELAKRRIRRKLMAKLTREFSAWNDQLLRELAR